MSEDICGLNWHLLKFSVKPNLCDRETNLCPSVLACMHESANIGATSRHKNTITSIFQQWSLMGFVILVNVFGLLISQKAGLRIGFYT